MPFILLLPLLVRLPVVVERAWPFIVDAAPIWLRMVGQAVVLAFGIAVVAASLAYVTQRVGRRRV